MDSDEIESTSSEEEDLFDIFNLHKSPQKPQKKTYSRSTRRNDSQESQSDSYSYKNARTNIGQAQSSEVSPRPKRKLASPAKKPRQKRYFNKSKLDDDEDDDMLNVDIPSIFKDNIQSQKVFEQHNKVNQRIEDQKKLETIRQQQREARIVRLLDELNQGEGKKFDLERDRSYLEGLLAKEEQALDGYGVSRHFYSLRSVTFDESKLEDYELSKHVSRSLQFLIAKDPVAGYDKVKPMFKPFMLRGMCSDNPRFLQSLQPLVLLHRDPIFSQDEFIELLSMIGVDTKSVTKEDLVLKIEHKSHHLEVQLERLALLFMAYLQCSAEVDFGMVARYFSLIISDYNANKQQLRSLTSFVYSVFPLLCARIENTHDLVSQLIQVISGISTSLPYDSDREKVKKMDLELHYNIIKLINVAFSSDRRLDAVINELNLQYLLGSDYRDHINKFGKQNLVYHIANKIIIEDNIKDLLELNDLQTADKIYSFYYKAKILPFILANPFNPTLNRKKNIKILRSLKSSVERVLQSCYGLIRDLGSINIEIAMATLRTGVDKFSFNREEMVRLLTDIHQDLSLQCDKLESDLKVINQDFFYG
ncbi:hypothetical protein I9W82_005407 [Candida metapsilosis]|uniref:Uncharacterized protein n=1 Tax=Candida metapsilosis TaxID=273372 RepID=A0A8H8DBI4_9ASCO|nr:hypothetical protein I9W82_005407 [Candida metapsilosis]